MKALIAGGGIGGLTAALSLHAAGIEVEVCESAPAILPKGVGINLQPNAVRELTELGLGEALAAAGIATGELAYYNRHGQLIWSEPRGLAAGYDWPQYSVHRGRLLVLLAEALAARAGPGSIVLGRHLSGFTHDEAGVTAHFTDPKSGMALESRRADILVGADGIHSAVRRQLYPEEGRTIFSGSVQWRGAVEWQPFLTGRTQVMIGHRDQRAVIYPIDDGSATDGRPLLNWVVLLANRSEESSRESWERGATLGRFITPFRGWKFDWLDVAGMIEATPEIFEFPLTDRDPLPRWSFGRVTLLGDAAHPMWPVGSQAGSQAIIDGRVLAFTLAKAPSPEAGLAFTRRNGSRR